VVGLTKQSNRQPQKQRAEGTASPAATTSSSRPTAKKQQTGARRTVNQLPCVDLTADNVNDDGKAAGGGEGTKETQDKIVAVMPGFIDLLFD
jgi:hypothetical protein